MVPMESIGSIGHKEISVGKYIFGLFVRDSELGNHTLRGHG